MRAFRFVTLAAKTLFSAVLLAGCDRLGAFNSWQAGDHSPTVSDLAYGEAPRQKIDLYLPDDAPGPVPLIVWFYGGSWDSGAKEKYAFVAKRFNEMGYGVAIPDYRLAPDVRFPDFLMDCAKAVGFMIDYARLYPDRIAPSPVMLAGHSAGAYNAVQIVADRTYFSALNIPHRDIAGIIGLSGPYDFHPYDVKATRTAFADTPAAQSQPVEQDLSHMPPMLLITGDRDRTVYPRNSQKLAKLSPAAKLVEVPEIGHAGTLIALGGYLTTNNAVLSPIGQFLDRHLPQRGAMSISAGFSPAK